MMSTSRANSDFLQVFDFVANSAATAGVDCIAQIPGGAMGLDALVWRRQDSAARSFQTARRGRCVFRSQG